MDSIYLNNYPEFAAKAKLYASQFNPCAILDSCDILPQLNKGKYKLLIGIGGRQIENSSVNEIDSLYSVWEKDETWMFGVLGYNLKNETEKLSSSNNACFHWPDLSFFVPEIIISVSWDNVLRIIGKTPDSVFETINKIKLDDLKSGSIKGNSILKADFNNQKHTNKVESIKEEIKNGNVYELNLCSRFLYENISIDNAYCLYDELIKISPSPFSGYFNLENKYVLSASPERYLSKNNSTLLSQPIKGTRPRGNNNLEDETYKTDLETNLKDRAENVMIVDLVRNDMARVARPGTVKVEELFGIYAYSHVYQMVSTVSSEIEDEYNWKDAIKATFPMGSMTGTPKIAAMQWIEKLEESDREWYSGALGYIDPEGNMDFNVLIRTIFYDSGLTKLAYYAGGAITIDSDPEEEYNEMMVKTKAISGLLEKYLKR